MVGRRNKLGRWVILAIFAIIGANVGLVWHKSKSNRLPLDQLHEGMTVSEVFEKLNQSPADWMEWNSEISGIDTYWHISEWCSVPRYKYFLSFRDGKFSQACKREVSFSETWYVLVSEIGLPTRSGWHALTDFNH
jgi:hypothetical protein